jgi:heme exporter protein B
MSATVAVLARDLRVAMRRAGEVLTPPLFFIIVATMVPLGLEPEPELLARVAPGILWTGALLASLLGLERLFASDFDDGSLEQLVLARDPLALLVLGKVAAHWLLTGLPLLLVAPLCAELLALPQSALPTLLLGLAFGTPTLALLGALGAALTVGARRSALLLPLLVLPLAVPLLIFGARAVDLAAAGEDPTGPLLLVASLALFTLSLAPAAIAAALRISLE